MRVSPRRTSMAALLSLMLTATAYADGVRNHRPPLGGPIFDITHFDVIPLAPPDVDIDFQQKGYGLLFNYRDASQSDPGLESFRVVNWIVAHNHSQIIDVWKSPEAFDRHLAQPHSIQFRFGVQGNPDLCCIGSPIDDRQYSLVRSFNTPWISNSLPSAVGEGGALFVVTYVDFLQELLEQDPDAGLDKLAKYGAETSKANGPHLLSYTVLQQLDRANRAAVLEVWGTQSNYADWQSSATTVKFLDGITPLLGSPLDHRLNILCGENFVNSTGCVPP
jgi:quinol monooxygenase YgiN